MAIMAANLLAPTAHAQNDRSSTENYPCARQRETIVQDAQGYSIRAVQVQSHAVAAAVDAIPASTVGIGVGLRIDAQLLLRASRSTGEASDAHR
jgi:hypothetical protein